MSRKNAPNTGGGLFSGVLGFTGTGTSETETSREKSGGATAGRNATELTKGRGNGQHAAAASGNPTETPAVPGLAELVEVLSAMAAAPLGARPKLNQDLIAKIKNSPLHPVLEELNVVYRKLGHLEGSPEHLQAQAQAHAQAQAAQRTEAHPPTSQPESAPGPGPSSARQEASHSATTPAAGSSTTQHPPPTPVLDVAELKNMEATLRSLSSKLDVVSQAVTDVTTRGEMIRNFNTLDSNLRQADSETRDAVNLSANVAKSQIDAVDKKVTNVADKLDPALAELKQGVKRLQAGLLDDAARTRLESKVKDLEKENKELQQVIYDANAELLPVEVVSKIALQGTLTDGPETGKQDNGKPGAGKPGIGKPDTSKPGGRGGPDNTAANLLQTAQRVRTNTLGLVAKCRVLFSFINRDPVTESDISDLDKEGEWGRCVEHLRASTSKLRNAVKEKEQSDQKLQFVGFVIEQIRKGHYTEDEWENDINWKSFAALVEKRPDGFESIQHLAQDLSKLIAQATTPPVHNGPTSATAFDGSQTPTVKPTNATPEAPVEPNSTPAFTAPGSPAVPTTQIPTKKDRDVKPSPTKKRSSSIRIKVVFNPKPGPLYGWGPIVE
ncbi:hypothetical protein FS837_010767 [Tulasnella sp. UAMH 9824]|nr:hypothetical protein FS837_010767 [Tulasnella sp. UAMH 9824]